MKISIIMVTYNAEKTIENSLLSLIKQDYKDKEIILIDGASTDRTVEIVERYKDYIDFMVSEPDRGIYHAANKGIEAATGDYIGFLNAGDWYINNHVLSEMAHRLSKNVDVYTGNMFLEVNGKWKRWISNPFLEALYSYCSLATPATFVRKSILKNLGKFNEEYRSSGDYELFLRLYTNHADFEVGGQYTTLMFDGGISSDPRKVGYKENRKIALQYGVPLVVASIRYWKNMIRHTIVRLLRRLKIDNTIKKILGQPPLLTVREMKELGIDIENPWFLDDNRQVRK